MSARPASIARLSNGRKNAERSSEHLARPDRGKRILILTSSVGAGHVRAAEALDVALRRLDPSALVHTVDVLSLTNALFRRLYGKAYVDLVSKNPNLAGMFYDWSDAPSSPDKASHRVRMLVERLNMGKLIGLLKFGPETAPDWLATGGWDMVVNTHFLPPEMVARLRRKTAQARWASTLRQCTVVTDFDAHGLWVNRPTDHYFAATDEAAISLAKWGVDPATISVTGIPIDPVFEIHKPKHEVAVKHNLSLDRPIILLMGGGCGLGPVEELVRTLRTLQRPLHLVVVCGRNATLKTRLERVKVAAHHRVTLLGFTKDMHDLLAAADLVVSKPGGLTTSEILARGAALAIINPIPGQEMRNSDYLLEHGAAIKVASPAILAYKLQKLLDDPTRLETLRRNALALGRPDSAARVARAVLELCAQSPC